MIGAPGAGKGTQAQRLSAALGLGHVSTGELFRGAVREGNSLGAEVRRYVERGRLVPDDLTTRVVGQRLREPDVAAGAILDGYPRTRDQAEALDELLARGHDRVAAALYVEVDQDELVRRLSGRRVCSRDDQHVYHLESHPPARPGVCDVDGARLIQRPDDQPETVRARLERQLPPMYEVIDHYAERGVLFAVRGDQAVDVVTEDLLRSVGSATRERV
jgi:adenylate kinase